MARVAAREIAPINAQLRKREKGPGIPGLLQVAQMYRGLPESWKDNIAAFPGKVAGLFKGSGATTDDFNAQDIHENEEALRSLGTLPDADPDLSDMADAFAQLDIGNMPVARDFGEIANHLAKQMEADEQSRAAAANREDEVSSEEGRTALDESIESLPNNSYEDVQRKIRMENVGQDDDVFDTFSKLLVGK